MKTDYFVYVLSCSDSSLYTGYTSDLNRRLAQHAAGRAAKYTRGRLPVSVIAYWSGLDRRTAMSAEALIKRLDRSAKLALLSCTNEQRLGGIVLPPPKWDMDHLDVLASSV